MESISEWSILESDEYPMMSSPLPVFAVAALYLYFVLRLGPELMSRKQPMDLTLIIQVYNLAQVVFSSWWFYESILAINQLGFKVSFNLAKGCSMAPDQVQPKLYLLSYAYLVSKLVELLDTVFFVLRRKENQVSFLHVYHHTNMFVSTWFFVKFVPAQQYIVIGVINTLVHAIMYGYYFLSALGPKIQKHLWWKKYLTGIQITQFIIIISYFFSLFLWGCSTPATFIVFSVGNTISFLALFLNFYLKSYLKQTTTKLNIEKTS